MKEIALGLLVLAKQEHAEAGCFSKDGMPECAVCKAIAKYEAALRIACAEKERAK